MVALTCFQRLYGTLQLYNQDNLNLLIQVTDRLEYPALEVLRQVFSLEEVFNRFVSSAKKFLVSLSTCK